MVNKIDKYLVNEGNVKGTYNKFIRFTNNIEKGMNALRSLCKGEDFLKSYVKELENAEDVLDDVFGDIEMELEERS